MSQQIVIIGGSVAGLAAGMAFSRAGHRVVILEKDATPLPESPLEAFENWRRPGAPQTRHSHAFLARLRNSLCSDAPELLASLLEHGVTELRFEDAIQRDFPDAQAETEDEQVTLLACRRITFEWVLRKHVLMTGLAEFRDGMEVDGLCSELDPKTGLQRVTAVKLRNADEALAADLVLDASGRRSRLDYWLAEIGAQELTQESEPCGIFYSSRFYRLHDGAKAPGGVQGVDLGYLKYGVFPGDSRIFSITMCASPHDEGLSTLLRPPGFEAAATAIPGLAMWVDPEVSEPISAIHGMGDLNNTRRFLVTEGEPIALGVLAIGDALIHTNPLNGRGCTLAWIGAGLAADCLAAHPDDLRDMALAFEEAVEQEIVPSYRATRMQDRDAIDVGEQQVRGEDPYQFQGSDGVVDPRKYMRAVLRDGLGPGLREDLTLLRAFMRVFNLLEKPDTLMKQPELMQKVLASFARRDEREPLVRGPSRTEMVNLLAAAVDTPAKRAS